MVTGVVLPRKSIASPVVIFRVTQLRVITSRPDYRNALDFGVGESSIQRLQLVQNAARDNCRDDLIEFDSTGEEPV